jgi:alanine racemase
MNRVLYTAEYLSQIIANHSVLKQPQQLIKHLLTDSRKISDPSSSVFFAVKGIRDGHQYIQSLYEKGLRCFVISNPNFNIQAFADANFIYVSDSLKALQKVAAHHRGHFNIPVIGITGSNGKTIVKEWLFQLLVANYKIVRSPKSYNSQIGVPLSVWQMNETDELAIFEAGISTVDEMLHLKEIIKPSIGILTNIDSAHDEGFENREQKLKEKLNFFENSEIIIINAKYISALAKQNKFTWSFDEDADLRIYKVINEQNLSIIKANYLKKEVEIKVPFNNQASIENAVICWATLLHLGIKQEIIYQRMVKLLTVKMRLELKTGINQTTIIDDSYNSDFSSLAIALDFLNQQNQHPTKTVILSDIHQTGIPSSQLYQDVAQLLSNKGINKFIGIGEEVYQNKHLFKANSAFYNTTNDFLKYFDYQTLKNESVLIKGARHFEFERISKVLTQKVHDTVLEINLNALINNLNYYKSKLLPHVKLMAVVKAFAYGSGSDEVAKLLQHNRVDYLAVAYADEGVALRSAGITLPIMVMSPEISSFEAIVKYQLEPQIYSFRILEAFANFIQTLKLEEYPIHLKLDTGMHRLGFMMDEIYRLIISLKEKSFLKVKSILSHLAASESDQHIAYTQQQIEDFKNATQQLENALQYNFIKHIANTSAISRLPDAQFDMVRLGIGLYGIESVHAERVHLENVATLKTTITQIKALKKGETVGYGRKGVMTKDGKIATVKIGYADGYLRDLGNGVGKMLIKNQVAHTIGNICMDMCMLDVTDLDVNEGDDVIIFGEELSVYNLADQLQTIPYEILTNISQRVKRVYFYE